MIFLVRYGFILYILRVDSYYGNDSKFWDRHNRANSVDPGSSHFAVQSAFYVGINSW